VRTLKRRFVSNGIRSDRAYQAHMVRTNAAVVVLTVCYETSVKRKKKEKYIFEGRFVFGCYDAWTGGTR
jgi:hypothetical protein